MSNKFIEIVPITYTGSMGLSQTEDYFYTPLVFAKELGLKPEVVSTSEIGVQIDVSKKGVQNQKFKTHYITNWVKYFKYLFKNNKEIIYSNSRVPKSLIAGLFGKYNIFISHHANLPIKFWQRMIFRFFANRFDAIRVCNPYEKTELIRLGVKKKIIHLIPLVVDHEFYSKKVIDSVQTKTKKKYGLKKRDIVLVYLANIRSLKRMDTVLKALKKLNDESNNKNYKLLVCGKDFLYQEKLKSVKQMTEEMGLKDYVIETGWLSFEEIRNVLSVANINVYSSIREGQCLGVYESAAAGLPQCLSTIGSFTSVFSESALFHHPDDWNRLAKNIKYYSNNKKTVKKHISTNKKIVSETCDYEKIRFQLKDLIKKGL